ncbi:MFS transporter [Pedobacter hartonius]|uniref:MFS transporter, DHA1 family, inner membrane transport protein n=1 Tax=Pedobacter hartonius TaxID=425514 RepID=A0A1H4CNJ7_9SPHI|nr:MFS transporter [Pedobacter hartonius]SEA62015.1 MFS transporter, DHA1 family, inner membrane transport protein [Pedobacter hartonius]
MQNEKFNSKIFVLTLATFAVGTETHVFSGLLTKLAEDMHVSISTAGQLSSSFAIAYALSAPFMGGFAARFERKQVLITALTVLAAINFIAAEMTNFDSLIAVRIAGGIVASLITPVATASASALAHDKHRGKALAFVLGGITLSFVLGIPIGNLIGSAFSWRATFVFSGMLILSAAIAVAFMLPKVPNTDHRGIKSFSVIKQPAVYSNLLLTMITYLATFSLVAYLSPVAKQVAGIEGGKISLLQFTIGAGSVLGIIIGGKLADHRFTSKVLKIGFFFLSFILLLFSLLMLKVIALGSIGNAFFLGIIFFAGASAQSSLNPIIQGRLVGAAPNNRNVVLAFNGSMIFLGQGCGAALGGLVISHVGLSYLGITGCLIAFIGFLLTFITQTKTASAISLNS